jgi:hypothetical protein
MRKVKGNATIGTGTKVQFEKEIIAFAKQLNAFVNGQTQTLFGSTIEAKMPTTNTQEILERYVRLGTTELTAQGVRKMRAQSMAKHIFGKLLETVMNEIEQDLAQ